MPDKNLATMFQSRVYRYGDRKGFLHKRKGVWLAHPWEEMGRRVEWIGRGLIALGVDRGDRVAIFSGNRPEWAMADLAVLSIGAVSVPIYPNTIPDQVKYLLGHSGAKAVFVSSKEAEKAVETVRESLPDLKTVISFGDTESDAETVTPFSLKDLEERGREVPAVRFYDLLEQVASEDLATLTYTSGTTGDPKGVMLTHGNILSNCVAAAGVFPLTEDDTCLSFLPLSHALERTAGFFAMIYKGATIAYSEDLGKVAQHIREVKPTILISVPRILEKMHARILAEVGTKPRWVRYLFRKATEVPSEESKGKKHGLMAPVYERAFFRRIRDQLGGRLKHIVCGGAAMNPLIALFFRAVGLEVLEGYGLTEAAPIVSVNLPSRNKLGTVGLALPGVQVRIAPDGEILLKGPNVMTGYFRDPDATREAIDPEGYLHTGDIGRLDSEGFLSLVDRKKELIVTSGGKNVAPALIENALKTSSLIEQACVFGEGKRFLAALLVPNFRLLDERAASQGLPTSDRTALIAHPTVRQWFDEIVNQVNSGLSAYETIKRYSLLPQEFSAERQEITPTMKLRRRVIHEHHRDTVEGLFE